jgi:endonuclease/exonuclease/phosphatase family metal-dependent hydrolase
MVTWVRLAIINRHGEGEVKPYPIDYRGHWENNQEFYVLSTHFFDRADQVLARGNSARLVMEKIKSFRRFGEWTKERPVFLMGDFNTRPGGEVYRTFVGDENSKDPLLLKDCLKGGSGIDWILYRGNVQVVHYEQVDYNVKGVYPSDHKPISVELRILEE